MFDAYKAHHTKVFRQKSNQSFAWLGSLAIGPKKLIKRITVIFFLCYKSTQAEISQGQDIFSDLKF